MRQVPYQRVIISILVCIFILGLQRIPTVALIQQQADKSIALISAYVSDVFAPFSFISDITKSREQLATDILKSELINRNQEAKLAQIQELKEENYQLTMLIASSSSLQKKWVITHVAGLPGEEVVPVGTIAGVGSHAMILSNGALLGVTDNVTQMISKVDRIGTSELTIGVEHQKTGNKGILIEHSGVPTIEFLSIVEGIQHGDVIVSVEDEGGVSSGIYIGTVKDILTTSSDPVTKVSVNLATQPQIDSLVLVQRNL